MGKWKDCCKNWYQSQLPKHPKEGRFQETHSCPTCETPLDIIFYCQPQSDSHLLQEHHKLSCKVIGVEDNT